MNKCIFWLYLGLVWFYDTSIIMGYLMPNHIYTNILNMIFKHILLMTFLKERKLNFFLHLNICLYTVK